MATGSYLTPIYSRSQSEVQGDHHKYSRLRPTTGVHLTPCHDELREPRSDNVRQVVLATTTTHSAVTGATLIVSDNVLEVMLNDYYCKNK
ncbi:hypothetical protein TNCV_569151 [Trichonephila clavipes]|nr:hypothetical protein TNCV_569151 [Trichonephila clavipes]